MLISLSLSSLFCSESSSLLHTINLLKSSRDKWWFSMITFTMCHVRCEIAGWQQLKFSKCLCQIGMPRCWQILNDFCCLHFECVWNEIFHLNFTAIKLLLLFIDKFVDCQFPFPCDMTYGDFVVSPKALEKFPIKNIFIFSALARSLTRQKPIN